MSVFPDLIINGETVPQKIIAAELQNHFAPRGDPKLAWRKAANALVVRTLLLQEARRRGILDSPQEVGPGRYETEEEALIRGLLEVAVQIDAPDEAEIRAEWERDPARFKTPPLWEVSHILCACVAGDEKSMEQAHIRAVALTARAMESPQDFARLAGKESDCNSRGSGGALGQLGPGDTEPEFEAVIRRLAEGEISPKPILTRHGYHIIRLDAVAEGQVLPYAAVKLKIAEAIEKTAWARTAKVFIGELVEAADISGIEL